MLRSTVGHQSNERTDVLPVVREPQPAQPTDTRDQPTVHAAVPKRSAHAAPTHAPAHHGFAWLRMIGSLVVIVEHSSPLTGNGNSVFPESWKFMPGYAALLGFFAMSGYQIAESWMRDPSAVRFAVKRVLRIWPPLLTVVLLTVFVIGPLVTVLPTARYFDTPATWGYVVNNAGLFNLQHELPGVFANNIYPHSANGSLWTLPMEVVGYMLVLAIGVLGVMRRWPWVLFLLIIGLIALDRRFQAAPGDAGGGGNLVNIPVGSTVAFLVAFAIGMTLYLYRDRIPLRPGVASLMLLLQVAIHTTPVGPFWLGITASYGAITLAHHWPARLQVSGTWINGSYGVYVWGFPIQQILILAGVVNQWFLILAAMPLAYFAGVLSWKVVEEPTLRLRHSLLPKKRKQPRHDWS